ncbi:MAG: hypothetical protein ABIH23_35750 [bacterium]
MNAQYGFDERLAFSKGIVAATCKETIQNLIPGCVEVREASAEMDKTGVDYIATLRRGAVVYIDHKARDKGCGKFWKLRENGTREPELALELWSVMPTNGSDGKPGWTLDEAKKTHYTLHTFDPDDSKEAFLLPFQILRKAYRQNFALWNSSFKHGIQDSGRWKSECVFVPAPIVLIALKAAMQAAGIVITQQPSDGREVQGTLF